MSIVDQLKQAQSDAKEMGNTAMPFTSIFDPQDWEGLAEGIAQAYPDLSVDADQVRKGGKTADGNPVKLAVFVAPRNRAEGIPARNVTLYSSGKAVWTNLEPVSA